MTNKTLTVSAAQSKIQGEMALQLALGGAPEDVHLFLMRDWTRLLTNIYMASGNQGSDWKAGWETVHALLWSLAPKRGREETSALLRMLPILLARLHAGCTALGMALAERDNLFERMAMLHAAIVREGLQVSEEEERLIPPLPKELSLDGGDLHDLNAPDVAIQNQQEASLPKLKLGDRVAFRGKAAERTLVLTWISPMGGMYMFANEQGMDAVTLTHPRLEAKLRAGEASLLPEP